MAYDVDALRAIGNERFEARKRTASPPHPKDLEAIATLLEVAALSLTPEPNATFTREELIKEAQDLGDGEVAIEEEDIKIVLSKARFLARANGRWRLK